MSFYKKTLLMLFTLLFTFSIDAAMMSVDSIVKSNMTTFMKQRGISGAEVLIYHHGKMTAYSFGVVNVHTKRAVNDNTVFELGSISKTFTGLLLAEEVTSGSLKFNDPLADLLPTSQSTSASINQIQLLELATHTASLPFNLSNIPYNASASQHYKAALNNFLMHWRAPYPPGTKFLYSNVGFGLLGIALGNAVHMPLAQLIQKNILLPLNMNHSGLTAPLKNYAQGYTAEGKPARSPQLGLLGGGWGMKSTGHDMQLYLKAALLLPTTPADIAKAMRVAQTAYVSEQGKQMGLAWNITPLKGVKRDTLLHAPFHHQMEPVNIVHISHPNYNPTALIDKTGATNGFRAYIGLLPAKKDGIVIMINRFIGDSGALQNIGRKMLFTISDRSH